MDALVDRETRRTRVKFCGLTQAADVALACTLGADAVGFVCHAPSPRFVAPERLAELARALAPWVTPVLLFVDAPAHEIARALRAVPQATLQFHGSEDPDFCAQFARPYLRAVVLGKEGDLVEFESRFPGAAALLADAASAEHGGSGRTFDWNLVPAPEHRRLPLVLAGGLDAGNVAAAIERVRPYAVDVSSGVEQARGIKSAARMRSFIAAVRDADARIGAV
jgi:phosphoribosylanthranilate isomerase